MNIHEPCYCTVYVYVVIHLVEVFHYDLYVLRVMVFNQLSMFMLSFTDPVIVLSMFMLSFTGPAIVLSMFMLSFTDPVIVLSMFMLSFIFCDSV